MKSVLLILALLISSGAQAEISGREGGGGGGIKVNGRVYTLAEAGLRLADPETPYFPDQETVEATIWATQQIDGILPMAYKKILSQAIFENKHLYQKVEVVNPELFEKLKNEYAKYVDTLPIKGVFVLPAYTEGKVTYLFPDFFDAAPASRALYLIHESAFYLRPDAKLHDVLRLEIAALDFLKDPTSTAKKIAIFDAYGALMFFNATFPAYNENSWFALYLQALIAHGMDFRLSHFLSPDISIGRNSCGGPRNVTVAYETDAVILSRLKDLEPSFFRRFYRKSVSVHSTNNRDIGFAEDYYGLGCGVIDKTPENYRISVREIAGLPVIYATAIDQASAPPSDSRLKVVEAQLEFFLPSKR